MPRLSVQTVVVYSDALQLHHTQITSQIVAYNYDYASDEMRSSREKAKAFRKKERIDGVYNPKLMYNMEVQNLTHSWKRRWTVSAKMISCAERRRYMNRISTPSVSAISAKTRRST